MGFRLSGESRKNMRFGESLVGIFFKNENTFQEIH